MPKEVKTTFRSGGWEASIVEVHDHAPRVHDYGLSAMAWRRAAAILAVHEADSALRMLDERAMRAYDRGDLPTCLRWRELMTGIHAISSDEPLAGERRQ